MPRPPIPAPPYEGGCLCGQLRWRLAARPLAINACHCDDCRKLTGAGPLLMLLARREAFTSEGPAQRYRKRAISGREIDLVRCAVCGTRLWHEPLASPTLVFIAAGTLDDARWAVPSSHIWIEKARSGTVFEADALQLQGQPATREMLMEAFAALYGAPTHA